ncbi:hypothetical protein DBR40_01735 [Pedobacter sp. KBW01]|uniref:hypothetical protein n=1 Tax=Pedobacter sp. KBW01 TaxID=2153364 RepID=UPI000F5AD83F|nr:hypothetical protein [Pedobacter sp. KBW01]RQO79703.1 hypothetical protein DBR40_01735 [Pedobacter sp. KBW01]
MKEGKDIDKLFKDGLGNPDLPFNDLDWDNLEERLHPKPKRRVVPVVWLAAVAGIAAMLLIVFLLVKPLDNQPDANKVVKTDKGEKNNPKPENNAGKATETPLKQNDGMVNKDSAVVATNEAGRSHLVEKNILTDTDAPKLAFVEPANTNLLANKVYQPALSTAIDPVTFKDQNLIASVAIGKPQPFKEPVLNKKPRLVLSILAAPDLTSVQKSGTSNLSGGFGVEATYILSKKLSVTTGATYAKKIYDSDFSLYRPNTNYVFKIIPSNIHANCDVIDIPLNVNYKVFGNSRNAISVSTGLSSYLMLKEKYSYSYDGAYQGPQEYEVRGRNQHYLGIANIGVEFQHKINNNLSISAKPFMKIPLTDIGYGNSRLSSTGVAVSVNMNLFGKGN